MPRLPGIDFAFACLFAALCLNWHDREGELHCDRVPKSAMVVRERSAFRARFAARKWLLDEGGGRPSRVAGAATWLGWVPRNQTLAYALEIIGAERGLALDTYFVGRALALGLFDETGLARLETPAGGEAPAELLLRREDAGSLEWIVCKKGAAAFEALATGETLIEFLLRRENIALLKRMPPLCSCVCPGYSPLARRASSFCCSRKTPTRSSG